MHATKIVTSFIKSNNKILILKRSEKVKSMKGLWAGISGIIEKDEDQSYQKPSNGGIDLNMNDDLDSEYEKF